MAKYHDEIALKSINAYSKKNYGLYRANGRVMLVENKDGGGISQVSESMTSAEMSRLLVALENYAYRENGVQ